MDLIIKKMKSIPITLSILILLFIGGNKIINAQDSIPFQRTKVFNPKNFKDFFFHGIGGTAFTSFTYTKVYGYKTLSEMGVYTFKEPLNHVFVSIIHAKYSLRLDLIQYDDLISLSVCTPLSINFFPYDGLKSPTLIFLESDYFIQLNFFRNSSKRIMDSKGFNIAYGWHHTLFPLRYKSNEPNDYLISQKQKMKVVKFEYVYKSKKKSTRRLQFIFGINSKITKYYIDFNQQLTNYSNGYFNLSYMYSF